MDSKVLLMKLISILQSLINEKIMKLTIYLRAEGDGFDIKKSKSFENIGQEDADHIHPIIGQICSANSQEEVVSALRAFRLSAKNHNISYTFHGSSSYIIQQNNQEDITITLMHEHARNYQGHYDLKGAAHNDSIEKMIAFAEGSDRQAVPSCIIF